MKKLCKQEVIGMMIHSILFNAPIQATLLNVCTLNLKFLFRLLNQKDEIGILNSMYTNQAA